MLVNFNYDDRKNLPDDAHSNMGYAALDKHFPVSSTVQQFILIQSPHDLRSPKALADMEQMAQRVSQLPDIEMVRGVTRPTGEMLQEARATWQAGEVGGKLNDASTLIDANDANLSTLSGGAHKLADVLGQISTQVTNALVTVRPLAGALADMETKYGGEKTLDQIDQSAELVANMRSLGRAMGVNLARITDVYDWSAPMVRALNVSPECNLDPACAASRSDLQRIVEAKDNGNLDKFAELGRQLESPKVTRPSTRRSPVCSRASRRPRRPLGNWGSKTRAASSDSSTSWNRASTCSPIPAISSHRACSCSSTRPGTWAKASTRPHSSCSR